MTSGGNTPEDSLKQAVEVRLGKINATVRDEQPVVDRAIQQVQDDIGVEAMPKLLVLNTPSDDRPSHFPSRLNPTCDHRLA